VSKKRKKRREKLKKQEIERNRGRVYCTVKGMCEGACKEENFRRFSRICSEAFYMTAEGEIPVKAL
jgi:hypothetical protein